MSGFDSRLVGGPLHGRRQVFGHRPIGYDFEPGEDEVYRFVHSANEA